MSRENAGGWSRGCGGPTAGNARGRGRGRVAIAALRSIVYAMLYLSGLSFQEGLPGGGFAESLSEEERRVARLGGPRLLKGSSRHLEREWAT